MDLIEADAVGRMIRRGGRVKATYLAYVMCRYAVVVEYGAGLREYLWTREDGARWS